MVAQWAKVVSQLRDRMVCIPVAAFAYDLVNKLLAFVNILEPVPFLTVTKKQRDETE